ncbi:hypothetical protein D3C78_1893560 [compost metagenome]
MAPRHRAERINSGLTDFRPSSVLVSTGMKVVQAISSTLGISPIPNQMMKMGSRAKAGIGPSRFRTGLSQ